MCQARINSIEGQGVSNVNLFDLSTIGTTSMLERDDSSVASFEDNLNVYAANIIMYRSG